MKLGTLKKGQIANFIITSGNLFSADNVIYENWMRGKQYIVNSKDAADLRGVWNLTSGLVPQSNPEIEHNGKIARKTGISDCCRYAETHAESGFIGRYYLDSGTA